MIKTKKSLLVTLADKNYIRQAKQLFSSVYFNAGWKGDYMLLSHEIPEKELRWFRKKGILIYKCKPIVKEKIYGRLSSSMLDKFYLFAPEFKKWKTIVYLDADIIVNANLDWLETLKGFWAAQDIFMFSINSNISEQARKTKINKIKELRKLYNLNNKAFNAGVFVLETKIIRKNDFEDLRKRIFYYKDIANWGDQLIMNLFFYRKWQRLPRVFNTFIAYPEEEYALPPKEIEGIIYHFCGLKTKPWEKNSPFYGPWCKNLAKAEKINLKKIPLPKKIWFADEIRRIDRYLTKMVVVATIKRLIDKKIGCIGLWIKKRNPKLYDIIKLKK
jgi:lipopolysaccharide biosynthesis glycosyltransferase